MDPKNDEVDLNDGTWLGKKEAATVLRVMPRQLERRAEQGYIRKVTAEKKPWQKSPNVYYSRADIEAILRGKPNTYPVLMSEEKPKAAQRKPLAMSTEIAVSAPAEPPAISPLRELAEHLASIAAQKPHETTWLSLREAAKYSGLPMRYLKEQAEAGAPFARNVGIKTVRWMFHRSEL